jgi:glycosyltransferase involved in cell wall biosynthesis
LNICLVSQEYPPETAWGGIGTQTRNKARALARLGHQVHVLTRAADPGPDMRIENDGGVMVHRMQPPGFEFPIYGDPTYLLGYSWHVLRALHRLMDATPFDVLDFPEYGGEGFAYLLDRRAWNWAPVVVQLHGPLAMCAEYMDWPRKCGRFYQMGSFMEEFSLKRADGLMACSAAVADLAGRYYGIAREAIDVVHCGVDADSFQPCNGSRTAVKRPTVLFVGYIVENKGPHILVDAVLRLRSKYPTIRLQLLGPSGFLQERLQAQIHAAGAEANVDFVGFVDLGRLPEYYRAADVFCAPAAEFEGFGQVNLEAMACGCPVVASTSGGAVEAVVHGQTGMLVPANDTSATAVALDQLLSDAPLRRRLGEAGRQRVENYFALDKFIQRVLATYHKAIERAQHSPDRDEGPRE